MIPEGTALWDFPYSIHAYSGFSEAKLLLRLGISLEYIFLIGLLERIDWPNPGPAPITALFQGD